MGTNENDVLDRPAEATQPQNKSLVLVSDTLKEYDRVEAGIADLRTKYKDVVYAVSTAAGMEEAKAARVALRDPRYAVANAAKAAKAPLNELKREIDERAAEITAQLVDLETPIQQQIKAEEDRVAAAKEAALKAKREAAARAQTAIDEIRGIAVKAATSTAAAIDTMRTWLDAMEASVEAFGDRAGEAMQAKMQVFQTLDTLHAAAVSREAAEARAAADRKELDEMRAAQAERERKATEEREAQEKAAKEKSEAEAAASKKKLDDERAAFELQQQQSREQLKAESDRLEQERIKLAAEQRAEQDKRDAAKRQAEKQAQAKAAEIRAARYKEIGEIGNLRHIAQYGEAPTFLVSSVEQARSAFERAKAWTVTEEVFGDLLPEAKKAQDDAIASTGLIIQQFEAAARQAEERRQQEAAHAADQLRRNAAGVMLDALQAVTKDDEFDGLAPATQQQIFAAITAATKEKS